jgi:mono/diheme cytochrome c family protein
MKPYRVLVACALAIAAGGCERGMHDMYDQPRYKLGGEAPLFTDDVSTRTPPDGAVAITDPEARPARQALTLALLQRGQQRYAIYCAPCHGVGGDGDGMVVRRGFPAPPSYHDARLRASTDEHLYDVITHGWGVMFPYADRVTPADRRAIIAYIRALQFSRNAPVDRLEPEDIARLHAVPMSRSQP